jgi:hypothetical protein
MQKALEIFSLMFLLGFSSPVVASPQWVIDKIALGVHSNEVDALYGPPASFETRGAFSKQYPIRAYYGENLTLPAVEWDSKLNVNRVTGESLRVDGLTVWKGASRTEVGKVLGLPSKVHGTVESYIHGKSELQVFYNTKGRVKMFNLRSQ